MVCRIAILGGGPSALYIYKKICEEPLENCEVDIFEAGDKIGCGMPYSVHGASREHITNISSDETPELPQSFVQWAQDQPTELLQKFDLEPSNFNPRQTVPRLLFGKYLSHQFELLVRTGRRKDIRTEIHLNCKVMDVVDDRERSKMTLVFQESGTRDYDIVIMCTGHIWPTTQEGKMPGYFDSPYPPSKLEKLVNVHIAIRGTSLTAIDAVRTLARHHGNFSADKLCNVTYKTHTRFDGFKITLHSTHGLLPAVRFHLQDPWLEDKLMLKPDEVTEIRSLYDGFVPLDLIFERKFKDQFRERDPDFYAYIQNMTLEDFVNDVMRYRSHIDPFILLKQEYDEAQASLAAHHSIYWKEMVNALSFVVNYPAKYLSAEDFLRLKNILQPLISVIIAYAPQQSCKELMALHEAGILTIAAVGKENYIECHEKEISYHYKTPDGTPVSASYSAFVDCVGQKHLPIDSFPFQSLVRSQTVSRAYVNFRSNDPAKELILRGNEDVTKAGDHYRLYVSGIAVNDSFQAVNEFQEASDRFYIMAVPYIGGHNPDYSGLDFCNEAASRIIAQIGDNLKKYSTKVATD